MSTFVNYIRDTTPLEERVAFLFDRLKVSSGNQEVIKSFLAPLRNKGPVYRFHYDHTLRVAILCAAVGKFMHLQERALLYAGLLHDIGKVQVPAETLGKTSGWTQEDTENIRPHVMDGYRMIRDKFDFTAEVTLWHHKFQTHGYPEKLPPSTHPYCLGSLLSIQLYGRILSLCDQYDAMHRINDHDGELKIPTGEEIKQSMFRMNRDRVDVLEELYGSGIFTTWTETV